MEAGRELDALVAEKIEGWDWYTVVGINVLLPPDHTYRKSPVLAQPGKHGHETDIDSDRFYDSRAGGRTMSIVRSYSTDIAAAWRVLEKLKTRGYTATIFVYGIGVQVHIETGGVVVAVVEHLDASHAICLAALRVLNVETPPETPRS